VVPLPCPLPLQMLEEPLGYRLPHEALAVCLGQIIQHFRSPQLHDRLDCVFEPHVVNPLRFARIHSSPRANDMQMRLEDQFAVVCLHDRDEERDRPGMRPGPLVNGMGAKRWQLHQ
jgi:hypothetical protein